MVSSRPWHNPGRWFTAPANWESQVVQQRAGMPQRVYIRDCTLKEGAETPGVVFSRENRLEIAKRLQDLGVASLDVGHPDDPQEQKDLLQEYLQAGVAIVKRYHRVRRELPYKDQRWREVMARALELGADEIDVGLGIKTADIWDDFSGVSSKQQVVEAIQETVQLAREGGASQVQVAWGHQTHFQVPTLCLFHGAAARAGATDLLVTDSMGVGTPAGIRYLVGQIKAAVGGTSVHFHCHNDLGMATANTIAAVEGGAEWVDVVVNGLGDRAGNAALEEVAVGLELLHNVNTRIKLDQLCALSQLVAKLAKVNPQPNKAIVGENAFLEESSQHFLGSMMAEKEGRGEAWVPFMPQLVGQRRRLVFGSSTLVGWAANGVIEYKLKEWGYPCTGEIVDRARRAALPQIEARGYLSEEEFRDLCRGIAET